MGGDIHRLISNVNETFKSIRGLREPISIVSSDDGDGLASTYLMSVLLDELGKAYNIIIVDRVYPELPMKLFERFESIIFLDLGGPYHVYIDEDRFRDIVIIDHHRESVRIPRDINYLNPVMMGFDERDTPSTSVIVYYMVRNVIKKFYRYAWAAILGMGEIPSELGELAWRALVEGIKAGVIKKVRRSYRLLVDGFQREFRSLYRDITLVSSMGYFDDLGLDIVGWMRYGGLEEIRRYIDGYRVKRKKLFDDMKSLFDSGDMVLEKFYIQWFEDYKKLFYNVSPRVFSSFSTTISMYGRYFNPNKYILGVTERNPYIPGYGNLVRRWSIVSIRTTKKIEFLIGVGKAQPVYALAEASAFRFGGLGYGYRHLGSAVVEKDKVNNFLNFFDSLASGR